MDVGRVVSYKRAARLLDMEAANSMSVVGEQVRVSQMTQVVGALPHLDKMGVAGDELHQSRRLTMQRSRIMQHYSNAPQVIGCKEVGQQLQAGGMVQLQALEISIEDQQFLLGMQQDGVASLAIFGFTGD